MSTRMIRPLALAAGAGALVLGAAAPAMAADVPVPTFPGPVTLKAATGDVAVVNAPIGMLCDGITWTWKIPGKQDAVKVNSGPTCANNAGATDGILTATVGINASPKGKKNAVVKFIGAKADGSKVVKTLVVKVVR